MTITIDRAVATSALPVMNTELVHDIVLWANQDQELIDLGKFPGNWNQGSWCEEVRNGVCQTAYCLAGQAVVQVGMVPVLNKTEVRTEGTVYNATECAPRVFAGLDDKGHVTWTANTSSATYRPIPDVAREALGLTPDEGGALFAGGNDLANIVALVSIFARVRGVDLNLPDKVLERFEEEHGRPVNTKSLRRWWRGNAGSNFYFDAAYIELVNESFQPATCSTCGQTLQEDE